MQIRVRYIVYACEYTIAQMLGKYSHLKHMLSCKPHSHVDHIQMFTTCSHVHKMLICTPNAPMYIECIADMYITLSWSSCWHDYAHVKFIIYSPCSHVHYAYLYILLTWTLNTQYIMLTRTPCSHVHHKAVFLEVLLSWGDIFGVTFSCQ
jgi:hypothetical protein